MKSRLIIVLLIISISFVSVNKAKSEDDHFFEAFEKTWDMLSDEQKGKLLEPVLTLGVELACETAKWGWNQLFGDSEEDIEKKALNGLECNSINYYSTFPLQNHYVINI